MIFGPAVPFTGEYLGPFALAPAWLRKPSRVIPEGFAFWAAASAHPLIRVYFLGSLFTKRPASDDLRSI